MTRLSRDVATALAVSALFFAFMGAFSYIDFLLEAPPFSLSPAVAGLVFCLWALVLAGPLAGRAAERHGWLPWEKSALALVWLAPLVARNLAALTLFPLGLLTAVLVLVLSVRRALKASPSRH